MRSFLSLAFFKPAKAILVPGMYCESQRCEETKSDLIGKQKQIRSGMGRDLTFLGFSRYSNSVSLSCRSSAITSMIKGRQVRRND